MNSYKKMWELIKNSIECKCNEENLPDPRKPRYGTYRSGVENTLKDLLLFMKNIEKENCIDNNV